MTPSECLKLVRKMQAAFPQRDLHVDTAKVYAEFLVDLAVEDAQAAVNHLITTEQWFPTIASIRQWVFNHTSGFPSAEAAWLEVEAAVESHPGVEGYILNGDRITNPIALEVARSMGANEIGKGNGPTRAHFFRLYDDGRKRAYEAETMKALAAGRTTPVLEPGG